VTYGGGAGGGGTLSITPPWDIISNITTGRDIDRITTSPPADFLRELRHNITQCRRMGRLVIVGGGSGGSGIDITIVPGSRRGKKEEGHHHRTHNIPIRANVSLGLAFGWNTLSTSEPSSLLPLCKVDECIPRKEMTSSSSAGTSSGSDVESAPTSQDVAWPSADSFSSYFQDADSPSSKQQSGRKWQKGCVEACQKGVSPFPPVSQSTFENGGPASSGGATDGTTPTPPAPSSIVHPLSLASSSKHESATHHGFSSAASSFLSGFKKCVCKCFHNMAQNEAGHYKSMLTKFQSYMKC